MACSTYDADCDKCNENGCTICKENYRLNATKNCNKCEVGNCADCQNDITKCNRCASNFVYNDTLVICTNPSNMASHNCPSGYVLDPIHTTNCIAC